MFSAVVDFDEQETGPFALVLDVDVRDTNAGAPPDAAHPGLQEHHPQLTSLLPLGRTSPGHRSGLTPA